MYCRRLIYGRAPELNADRDVSRFVERGRFALRPILLILSRSSILFFVKTQSIFIVCNMLLEKMSNMIIRIDVLFYLAEASNIFINNVKSNNNNELKNNIVIQ